MMAIVKKILSILGKIVCVALVVMMVFVLISRFSGKNPNLFGYKFYVIATDSMTPSLEVGDVIISKNVKDFSKLEIDDVITYNCEKGKLAGMSITHRIVEINEENGKFSFRTQGTKEGATVDEYAVEEYQIDGVMVSKVPLIGKLIGFITKPVVFFLMIIIPLCVCLFFEIKKVFEICKNKEEEETDEEQQN